jgi:sensor histidine kinase YesM
MIAAVIFFQKLSLFRHEEIERSVLQKQVQQFQQQVNDVDGIYSEIRGFRHDIKNHISNILVLANAIVEGNTDVKSELDEYLKKMGETLDKFEFTYNTGNSVSDIIIHQKHHEALKNEIDFTADFVYPLHLKIDAYDMAIILNNALENATEACKKMNNFERFIRLYAYTKGEMFFIEIENNFENGVILDKNTGLPNSSKADRSVHGIGLSNIRRCARKYFGDMDFQVSRANNSYVFRLTVMLQGRS